MQAHLEIDGILLPINHAGLSYVLRHVHDNSHGDLPAVLLKLCTHPSSEVRVVVAARDDLSKEMVKLLCRDDSFEVLKQLAQNEDAMAMLDTDDVIRMIDTDIDLAKAIPRLLSYGTHSAVNAKVIELLATHPDPSVRMELANYGSVPKKTLRRLAKDIDLLVRKTASDQLRDEYSIDVNP